MICQSDSRFSSITSACTAFSAACVNLSTSFASVALTAFSAEALTASSSFSFMVLSHVVAAFVVPLGLRRIQVAYLILAQN